MTWKIRIGLIISLLVVILISLLLKRGQLSETEDRGNRPRADIVNWIDSNFRHDEKKRMSLLRMAEVFQQIVIRDREDALEIEKFQYIAHNCTFSAFADDPSKYDGMDAWEYLETHYFNSFARARKYAGFNGELSGKMFPGGTLKWNPKCDSQFWPY